MVSQLGLWVKGSLQPENDERVPRRKREENNHQGSPAGPAADVRGGIYATLQHTQRSRKDVPLHCHCFLYQQRQPLSTKVDWRIHDSRARRRCTYAPNNTAAQRTSDRALLTDQVRITGAHGLELGQAVVASPALAVPHLYDVCMLYLAAEANEN
ncbi:uncharacterized protein SPSK_02007 [Sporothrix schenckii 1099-18]|uniref:Uncharacterized protein n=1 Tax=Sporothrix schenckii 1099-18 TaxID=1397361 RepID=A0A0F2ME32_SPOSC|nr:uncharacterized protein SPSK_02007 [Sporothrix schenckii 1099-18]KJR87095.1 hypothetical protein SPSK_02007 [Sporothrix schenckii 1099-18]